MGVLIRSAAVIAIVASGAAPPAISLEAQSVSTPGLMAAFIFNFVKFTTWPEEALHSGGAIVICVIGHDQVAEALV